MTRLCGRSRSNSRCHYVVTQSVLIANFCFLLCSAPNAPSLRPCINLSYMHVWKRKETKKGKNVFLRRRWRQQHKMLANLLLLGGGGGGGSDAILLMHTYYMIPELCLISTRFLAMPFECKKLLTTKSIASSTRNAADSLWQSLF